MPVTAAPNVLQPGDSLEIKFVYWPDYNETQTIRPDGKIWLPVVDEVQAAGLTPSELHANLLKAYEGVLQEPEIVILVRNEDVRKVYVGGEVNDPGSIPIVGQLTALEAIMEAGGPDKLSAKLSDVIVIRRAGAKHYARKVDLRAATHNPEADNFYLEANDIVFVPRTTIDRVDQFVDQYINQIIPERIFIGVDDIEEWFGEDDENGTTNTNRGTFSVPVISR